MIPYRDNNEPKNFRKKVGVLGTFFGADVGRGFSVKAEVSTTSYDW